MLTSFFKLCFGRLPYSIALRSKRSVVQGRIYAVPDSFIEIIRDLCRLNEHDERHAPGEAGSWERNG